MEFVDDVKLRRVEQLIRELLEIVGEDPDREGLRETPRRVAKMLLYELLSGYRVDPKQYLKSFPLEESEEGIDIVETSNFVAILNIPIRSLCEHHLLPIVGLAHIVYIPMERVLGISKFVRIVEAFSRRLQIQERLTDQIADFIYKEISPEGVLVVTEAIHLCALVRGIREPIKVVAVAHRGKFSRDPVLRSEAVNLIAMRRSQGILEELSELMKC